MSISTVHPDRGHFWRNAHRSAIASLLMVPVLLVWMLLLMPVGWGLQSAFGLADDQMLTEAGACGTAAFVLMVVLATAPQVAGIVLGLEARRHGERRLGTAGVVVNAVVAALLVAGTVAQALFG